MTKRLHRKTAGQKPEMVEVRVMLPREERTRMSGVLRRELRRSMLDVAALARCAGDRLVYVRDNIGTVRGVDMPDRVEQLQQKSLELERAAEGLLAAWSGARGMAARTR